LGGNVKGKRLGLVLNIGVGLTPQPAVRAAIEAAAKAFEHAGATIEPVAPLLTADILAGLDGFFQARLLAEYQLLPPDRQALHCRVVPARRASDRGRRRAQSRIYHADAREGGGSDRGLCLRAPVALCSCCRDGWVH
jgi:Asp-tRNA(Asn)/Glu-tRNA(Gln) amidotransferase A subunit family amidase